MHEIKAQEIFRKYSVFQNFLEANTGFTFCERKTCKQSKPTIGLGQRETNAEPMLQRHKEIRDWKEPENPVKIEKSEWRSKKRNSERITRTKEL